MLKTGVLWGGLGIAAAILVTAVSRCCIPLDLPWTTRRIVYFTSLLIWPTSALLPPIVDSVDPSRTYLEWATAVLANALPYSLVSLLRQTVRVCHALPAERINVRNFGTGQRSEAKAPEHPLCEACQIDERQWRVTEHEVRLAIRR